jgi:hypothetical protein
MLAHSRRTEQTTGLGIVVFVMLAAFAGYRFLYHAAYPIVKALSGPPSRSFRTARVRSCVQRRCTPTPDCR